MYDCQSMVWIFPFESNVTMPLSMSGVYVGGGITLSGFGGEGKVTPPVNPVYRSEIPVPVTNEPVTVSALARRAVGAGMIGISASRERPQPFVRLCPLP